MSLERIENSDLPVMNNLESERGAVDLSVLDRFIASLAPEEQRTIRIILTGQDREIESDRKPLQARPFEYLLTAMARNRQLTVDYVQQLYRRHFERPPEESEDAPDDDAGLPKVEASQIPDPAEIYNQLFQKDTRDMSGYTVLLNTATLLDVEIPQILRDEPAGDQQRQLFMQALIQLRGQMLGAIRTRDKAIERRKQQREKDKTKRESIPSPIQGDRAAFVVLKELHSTSKAGPELHEAVAADLAKLCVGITSRNLIRDMGVRTPEGFQGWGRSLKQRISGRKNAEKILEKVPVLARISLASHHLAHDIESSFAHLSCADLTRVIAYLRHISLDRENAVLDEQISQLQIVITVLENMLIGKLSEDIAKLDPKDAWIRVRKILEDGFYGPLRKAADHHDLEALVKHLKPAEKKDGEGPGHAPAGEKERTIGDLRKAGGAAVKGLLWASGLRRKGGGGEKKDGHGQGHGH